VRIFVTLLAAALVAGGIACLLLVHWLTGLFFIEVAGVLVIADRTVGLVPMLTATSSGEPATLRILMLWAAGALVVGLALAYAAIALDAPYILMAACMVGLAAWLFWVVRLLRGREQLA
jgi:hypothetical protein